MSEATPPKTIANDEDHAEALKRIETLMDLGENLTAAQEDELLELATAVGDYEDEHHAITGE